MVYKKEAIIAKHRIAVFITAWMIGIFNVSRYEQIMKVMGINTKDQH